MIVAMSRFLHRSVTLVLCGSGLAMAQPLVFTDVSVIPMDTERVLEHRDVLVRDGHIESLTPTGANIPDDAIVVSGTGKFLVPGLTEMHAHIPSAEAGEMERDRVFSLFVANGVTTVRGMLGHPVHLEWRSKAEEGDLLAPRIITAGPSFNGNSVSDPDQAERMVREQAAAGYDFLKLHPGLEREEFDRIATTANELNIPFAGHVSVDVGLQPTLAAGQATIDHLDGYMQELADETGSGGFFGVGLTEDVDESRIAVVAEQTAQAGVWNVPTQILMENVLSSTDPETMGAWPEMHYMPPAVVSEWVRRKRNQMNSPTYSAENTRKFIDIRRKLIAALNDSGAGLLLGSDAPQVLNVPGFSAHRELIVYVDAGLTPFEALRTGTANVADFFGTKEFGVIEEGRSADLILLDANPLEDIANIQRIEGVVLRGGWLSRDDLDQLLARFE